MAGQTPEVGDKASWNWNGSTPSGTVAEKKTEGEASVQSKRGNTIKKDAKPGDPAIALSRSGNDVVKNQSELQVEEKKADGGEETKEETPKEDEKKEEKTNGEAAAASPKKGEKRKADEDPEEDKPKAKRGRPAGGKAAEPKAKTEPKKKVEPKKKAEPKPKADGEKSRGRPKGSAATKKAEKSKAPATGIGKRTRSGGK